MRLHFILLLDFFFIVLVSFLLFLVFIGIICIFTFLLIIFSIILLCFLTILRCFSIPPRVPPLSFGKSCLWLYHKLFIIAEPLLTELHMEVTLSSKHQQIPVEGYSARISHEEDLSVQTTRH